MKKNTTPPHLRTNCTSLRKRIISILLSNAFKAATLAPLALAMAACKTETEPVIEKEDVIELSDLQVNLGGDLKVGSALSAQALWQGISVNLSINDGEKQRRTLEALFNEFKDKKTVAITITNNGNPIYTITNDNPPTKGYTFETEKNDFKVSVKIGNDSFNLSALTSFTVGPKEQGGKDPINPDPINPDPINPDPINPDPINPDPINPDPINPDPINPNPPVTGVITQTFDTLGALFNYAGKTISEGDQQTGNITLTAQTIKKLAALPSVLKIEIPADTKEEEKETKLKAAALAEYEKYKDLSTLVNAYDNKEIVVEKNGTRNIGNDYGVIDISINDITATANRFAETGLGEYYPLVREVESYKISKGNIILDGTFNYNEIDIQNDGASISVSENAVFSMKQEYKDKDYYFAMSPKSIFDMYARLFNTSLKDVITQSTESVARNAKTPKLDYYIHGITNIDGESINGLSNKDVSSNIVALHKLYNDNKDKLNLDVSIDHASFKQYPDGEIKYSTFEFQGADFFKDGETMFKGNNINTNNDIPNISADILREVSTKYNMNNIKNLIVTGDYTESKDKSVDINSKLTNVVFEGNVSGLKNSAAGQFTGVVYFMDTPYNNRKEDSVGSTVNGLLKLDKLEGVSYDTFIVDAGVLDLRGRDKLEHNPLEGYNIETNSEKAINHDGHNAIYFTRNYVDNIGGIDSKTLSLEEKFEILARRVKRVGKGGTPLCNVYVDNKKYDSIAERLAVGLDSENHAVSQTPRTLEEFEYFGNSLDLCGYLEEGKFKTPAYDSYKNEATGEYDFTDVDDVIIQILKKDKDSGNYCIP